MYLLKVRKKFLRLRSRARLVEKVFGITVTEPPPARTAGAAN
jgi:hypothetical protein